MELTLNNHIRIKYRTTFCFILAMYIFSIVTVSCRPSVDRIPPRPTIDDFNNNNNNNNKYQSQEQKQDQYDQQQQKQQQNLQLEQYEKHKSQEQQHQTDEKNMEKNEYGDLHPDKIRQIKKCNENMELMELCMRCAKVTKSRDVYPMCCDNEDHVKDWCVDYVYYGIGYSK